MGYLIEEDITTKLETGHTVGPFDTQPFDKFSVSLIRMIPQKNEPDIFRRIHALRFPNDNGDTSFGINSNLNLSYR